MPLPVTVASQLVREVSARLSDVAAPMSAAELRAELTRLRRAQRDAEAEELAPLFNTIGMVCLRLGEVKTALDAHRNAARYNTTHAIYPNNVAACLIELKQYQQALTALREAHLRPIKSPGTDVCILGNTAEIYHHFGNYDAARSAYEDALRHVDPARPMDLLYMASTAAILGDEETAVEFFARSLAVARGMDLGETPAIEFVRADPDYLKAVRASPSSALETAIERVGAWHDEPSPPEHQIVTQIALPEAALASLHEFIDHPS